MRDERHRIRSSITPARGSTCAKSGTRSSRCSASACRPRDSPLPGRDEIEHVRSDNATQFAPSPDGKWLAFEERFKTFVAPFPRTGRPVDIGPATQAYPVQRVSRDAGFYLHWSGDSRRLYWALGPELFSRELGQHLRVRSTGARRPERRTEPEAKGIPIGFTAKSDKPSGSIALVGARVITMAGLEPGPIAGTPGVIENATVLVEGNRIIAIGPSSSVPGAGRRAPSRRQGQDDHARDHRRARPSRRRVERADRAIELAARRQPRVRRHDVARSVERHRDRVHERRAGARAARKLGPRVFSTGTILYGAETPFKAVVESYEDALSHLRRQKAVGRVLA